MYLSRSRLNCVSSVVYPVLYTSHGVSILFPACTLTLESYCYLPSVGEEAVNLEARCHIEEYTWHVFSILADIIDAALIKLNTPVIVSDKCPPNLSQ